MAAAAGVKKLGLRESKSIIEQSIMAGGERSTPRLLPELEWLIFNKADPLRLIYTRRGDNFSAFFVQIS